MFQDDDGRFGLRSQGLMRLEDMAAQYQAPHDFERNYLNGLRNVANDPVHMAMWAQYAQPYRPPEPPASRAQRLAKIGVYEIAPGS